MVFSFLQRICHPLTRCIKKIADQPCYNVIFYLRGQNTNIKKGYTLCLPFIKKCCQIDTISTSYFERLFLQQNKIFFNTVLTRNVM